MIRSAFVQNGIAHIQAVVVKCWILILKWKRMKLAIKAAAVLKAIKQINTQTK